MNSIALSVLSLLCVSLASGRTVKYVLEGKDVTLECRIPRPLSQGVTLYWMGPVNGTMDNYAIGNATFNKDYRVDFRPHERRYDLTITRATYERNNGLFICRVKEEGTGFDLHTTNINLTVLIKPGSPRITPQHPSATQGHPISLTCASQGGSPDPEITWYRVRDGQRLQSVLKPGGGRDFPTTATLTLQPQREDDGAEFMCQVRNRALAPEEKMAATVRLNVDYYPIVKIEPSNPVRVIENADVTLTCSVDAKPSVQSVRWMRGGSFIQTTRRLTIRNASPNDAGRYICQADNRLGRPGEAEVTIDVLYPPSVSVISRIVANDGEDVGVACNVTANPHPDLVYWTKVGDPSFEQKRDYLRLSRVSANDHGDYVCHAVSMLSPSGSDRVSVEGNATTRIRIRHAPGKSFVFPSKPVAVENGPITLQCGAKPPGYPEPKYRWWRDDVPFELGENYTIPIATQSHEGAYHCQPFNSEGNGSLASVDLRVFQPPRILEGLKPTATYLRERTDLRLSCQAQGNPKPSATWLKDKEQIDGEGGLYSIEVNYKRIDPDEDYLVQSTLIFKGPKRIGKKALRPEDRGLYECAFENEAKSVSSSQLLRVQHPPSIASKQNKVAANLNEIAYIACKMRAYPPPEFQWLYNNNIIDSGRSRYSINDTTLEDDIYASVLTIRGVTHGDYGPYTCRASNDQGPTKTVIYLGEKSAPDPPTDLTIIEAGKDFVKVEFEEGFDGGFPDTNFSALLSTLGEERVVECWSQNPCLIDGLRHNTEYRLRLRARNPLGQSDYSEPILAITAIDPKSIPAPQIYAETDSGKILVTSQEVDFDLIGQLEVKYEGSLEWTKVPARVILEGSSGRYELGPLTGDTEVRAQLCLTKNKKICGPFEFAKQVEELPSALLEAGHGQNLLPIIIGCVVTAACLVALALLICCCCKQSRSTKLKNKGADLEVSHRGVVTPQAPPPPYYTVGLENKGMEGSIDRGLESDPAKSALYNSQPYEPYGQNTHMNHATTPNGLTGYMDNSYSNSNNGGSVNSQDSLWQVKGHHAADPNQMVPHQMDPMANQYNNQYSQYNPMVHGGYGISGYDDYAHYPPMSQHTGMPEEYPPHHGGYSMTPNPDPYVLHHPRADEGYDVSGMPNPSQGVPEMPHPDTKPQISFDESLESGFSTPNSRNRRIIREIIV